MRTCILVAMAWSALLTPPLALAQDSLQISAEPMLAEGTLGWISVRPGTGMRLTGGEAAGEPLHFEQMPDSSFRGLVAVPIETLDSFRVSLYVQRAESTDTVLTALPVRRGGYRSEVLAVAPAFVRPDSAAAARIQSEIARSRQVSRLSQERPRLWKGPFRLPRASRITSPFGTARVFNGEVQSRHLGTDFAGAVGAPVRAAGRGVVALVADFYLAGRAVYIDHGAGLVTAYFHLSRTDVRQGQIVAAGQRIGAVGRSGRVTGPHLHWVARYGGISVDPMSLLQLK
ncbi:MAG TPA: M23 family metallopeptidase [Gemmatimonadales bacterium]|nr:M23 family metallopeptidase [Gemmatimonadales bacterium]